MERAIAETDRRRTKQIRFNEEHGITPQTIRKRIADIMEGARDEGAQRRRRASGVGEDGAAYADVRPEDLGRLIGELEEKMFRHAELLEFEEAARVRDEIGRLKEQVLKT
jgi:excinuclease ABC subunit B